MWRSRTIRFASPAHRRGFTFLEIMLVVMIIGIMAAVIGPRLIGGSEKARISATKSQINAYKTALGMYEMYVGGFPTTDQGLEALVNRPADIDEDVWEKSMDELPRDGWGESFIYRYPGELGGDFDLISKGKDRTQGTEHDITNAPKPISND